MENKTEQNKFNDEATFNNTLVELLIKLFNEKLSSFLEFCIVTRKAKPIKAVIEILNQNQF